MKRIPLLTAAFLIFSAFAAFAGTAPKPSPVPKGEDDFARYIREMTHPAHLFILGSGKDFRALKREAQRLAVKLHRPFSTLKRVHKSEPNYNPKADEEFGYYLRRYDTTFPDGDKQFISVEESDNYPGLKPGLFIIVARICDTSKEAQKAAKAFRRTIPSAYAKRTKIYYGCMS